MAKNNFVAEVTFKVETSKGKRDFREKNEINYTIFVALLIFITANYKYL